MDHIVLVVDDSTDFLAIVELALEPLAKQHHLRILHATDGKEALSLLQQHPDTAVLLTDLAMPEMDGLELITESRKHYPLLQPVVLSGSSDGASVIEAMRAGASDYIVKPPTIAELERSLSHAIARYEELRRALQLQDRLRGYERELTIAADIQRHMLPPPIANDSQQRYRVSAMLLPARHVAGDFYDHWSTSDGRLILTLGDVSGKGVSAALWMAVTRTLLRSHLESDLSPALALERTNRVLASNNSRAYFVTALVVSFNPHSGELLIANAAHPSPIRIGKDGTLSHMNTKPGMPLGAIESSTYQCSSHTLEPGDRLVLFTDGILEAVASDLSAQETEWENLLRVVSVSSDHELISTIVARLSASWIAEHFPDDVTLLTLEYYGNTPRAQVLSHAEVEIPSPL